MVTTIQLVTVATVLAIVLGVLVGIVSALRQYTGFDYSITFLSFLLYSLPVFWVAVLAKVFLAIDFNDFLADPHISALAIIVSRRWSSVSSSPPPWAARACKRLRNFAIAAAVVVALLVYTNVTDWFTDPSIGIVLIAVSSVGWAFVITMLSTGLRNRRALYSALTVAASARCSGCRCSTSGTTRETPASSAGRWSSRMFVLALAVSAGIGCRLGRPRPHPLGPYGCPDRDPGLDDAVRGPGDAELGCLQQQRGDQGPTDRDPRPRRRPTSQGDFWIQTLDTFTHLLLPTATLVLISFASYTRYTRASMLEVMNQDYIRTARSKGLTERTVIMRHAFRNALLPLASIVPIDIITLLGGAVLTETVFGWFGMGRLFVDSLGNNQQDPVMAYIVIVGILAVLANFVADLIYAVLDPRIRVAG